MKKYMKPVMESETFVTNEFTSACLPETKLACLNMNSAKSVYLDTIPTGATSGDGVLSSSEMTDDNKFTDWNQMNDCGSDGDSSGGYHTYSNVDKSQLYFVVYSTSPLTYTAAYSTEDGEGSDKPHFISVTSVINAS